MLTLREVEPIGHLQPGETPVDTYFDLFSLASLTAFLALFIGRTIQLYVRDGIRVVTMIRGKPAAEKAVEVVFLLAFPLWVADVILHAWPGGPSIDPMLFSTTWTRWVGAPLAAAGVGLFAWALVSFGRSWRVGVDHGSPGALVTSGVFALSRNPIFLAMDLFLVGAALMSGRWIPAAVAVVALAGFHRQIRNEERFLENHYGDSYRAYRNRVRRYFGWVGAMRGCST